MFQIQLEFFVFSYFLSRYVVVEFCFGGCSCLFIVGVCFGYQIYLGVLNWLEGQVVQFQLYLKQLSYVYIIFYCFFYVNKELFLYFIYKMDGTQNEVE